LARLNLLGHIVPNRDAHAIELQKNFDSSMNPQTSLPPTQERVKSNYFQVLERVSVAARRSGRTSQEVTVVGVTKYFGPEVASFLVDAGCKELGESRPQSLWDKSESLTDSNIRWHMIGHMQRNKVKRTLPIVAVMHSLDSSRLLEQIQQDVGERTEPLQVLLEINISHEPDKTGLLIADAESILERWMEIKSHHPKLCISGLMGMGGLAGGADKTRQEFESMRVLRDQWRIRFGLALDHLSMGMSDDFEIAIEEGATMVRIGSVLFS
jgi:PLP dependent protein